MGLEDSNREAHRRIRVLWLAKGLGPGGTERLLVAAARVHDHGAFEVHAAYVVPAKDALVPDLRSASVEVHCLGGGRASGIRWVGRLRRLLAEERFDVVHAHSPLLAGAARLLVQTLPRRGRPALVTTEHNAWKTFAFPTRLLNGLTAGLDDASIAVSSETRESVWWPSLRRRTQVLVHGVDLAGVRARAADRDATRRALGLAPDEVAVVTVANYRRQKAYPDLLEAAAAVVAEHPHVRFLAVGQGPLRAEIEARHESLGLGGRLRLLGYRADAAAVVAAADIFTLASTYEGYPVALMEALALGIPVAATAVGGIAEAVTSGQEGLLVPPRRPDLLADAIGELAADPDLRRTMAAAARARGDGYDISVAVRRIEEIYRSVRRPRGVDVDG